MADSLHMKATSGDIRGDEHADIARAEIFQDCDALFLGDITRKRGAIDSVLAHDIGQPAGFILPITENNNPVQILASNDIVDKGDLFPGGYKVYDLIHSIHLDLLG